MTKFVSTAKFADGSIAARVSPTRYRWVSRTYPNGTYSNSKPGDRECIHMDEAEARKLITKEGDVYVLIATGETYTNRILALGAAVLIANAA